MDKRIAMKLAWSEQAKRDIQDIVDYYRPVAGIAVTQKIVRKIHIGAHALVANPRGGQREWLLEDNPREYRRIIVDNNKIIYYIERETIYITSVFDCRRDPAQLREIVTERNS
jgi:plasmid stabilization system protein ParE